MLAAASEAFQTWAPIATRMASVASPASARPPTRAAARAIASSPFVPITTQAHAAGERYQGNERGARPNKNARQNSGTNATAASSSRRSRRASHAPSRSRAFHVQNVAP